MVASARRLSEEAGLSNVHFEQADAQVHPFPAGRFSLGISRFGTMFFADPEAAFANIARSLRPGARLVQLVWQAREHQEWVSVISDALTGGRARPAPAADAPFSLAEPATIEHLLTAAGFIDVRFTDVREPVYYGPDADAAFNAIRGLWMTHDLLGDLNQAERALKRLRVALDPHHTEDGVWFDSRAWIITAHRQ
jgi:SAM-dependent methyltransferase